ncbi:phosphopentomutase [Paraburkholderia xenovorans]|uniref:phosphopentomutase n=1 Tax=Paraburkholderia xenovorans TaxID=36873 RepID=UPI0038B7C88C
MARAVVIVLDSFGLGATPDAADFGDVGADTLGHIASWREAQGRPLRLPQLAALGLGQAAQAASGAWPAGLDRCAEPLGAFGAARESSRAKDTPSGHWELMGCPVDFEWGYFPQHDDPSVPTFPEHLMRRWYDACELDGSLGNCHGSGTTLIERYGDEHVRSGLPICYTSNDSVFQIAVHERHFGLDRLYAICATAKRIFDEIGIARVIARPFDGQPGAYRRTAGRHDYTTPAPSATLLDTLAAAGREVHAIGKIHDIFGGRGITKHRSGDGNAALCEETLLALDECADGGLVFVNLVDFDMLYGHRRDVAGYADALEAFDRFLPTLTTRLRGDDLLALSADHGCDPSWPGNDHTREHVPLLFYGGGVPAARSLGIRDSFADLGQTVARHLGIAPLQHGRTCW